MTSDYIYIKLDIIDIKIDPRMFCSLSHNKALCLFIYFIQLHQGGVQKASKTDALAKWLLSVEIEMKRYSDRAPKCVPRYSTEETDSGWIYTGFCPFGNYPKLMTIDESILPWVNRLLVLFVCF